MYFSGRNDSNIYQSNKTDSFVENNRQIIRYCLASKSGGLDENGEIERDRFVSLAHELSHTQNRLSGVYDGAIWYRTYDNQIVLRDEISACFTENLIRLEHNMPMRISYTYREINHTKIYIPEQEGLLFTPKSALKGCK
ncbi:MAG: type III secretion system effector protein [Ignavibacteria bacterium]|nr:type III secretion system effector protein [Ignavibacteria bacterium]